MTGVLVYSRSQTGKPYYLVINKALHLDHLEYLFIFTMQHRTDLTKINKTPKYHIKIPFESTHDIQVEDLS